MSFGFNGRIPFGYMGGPKGGGGLVDGSDGDLVVLNGQTHQLTAGAIYSFNSIDVQAGGILEIVGTENSVTQVGCLNQFIVNGTFRGKTNQDVGTFGVVDNWLNLNFSYTQLQSSGGVGGDSWGSHQRPSSELWNGFFVGAVITGSGYWCGRGGPQVNGHGGGGGGGCRALSETGPSSWPMGGNGAYFNNGSNQYQPIGPNGEYGGYRNKDSGTFYDNGGIGGTSFNGGHGGPAYITVDLAGNTRNITNGAYGGGGGGGGGIVQLMGDKQTSDSWKTLGGAGGGGRGEHGRRVFILAEQGISGSGTIDFAGNNGYNATQYYTASNPTPIDSDYRRGGGGGGGAGGSGGAVWIRHLGTSTVTPTILTNGGSGGIRSKLNNLDALNDYGFSNGKQTGGGQPSNGSNGSNGIVDVQSI